MTSAMTPKQHSPLPSQPSLTPTTTLSVSFTGSASSSPISSPIYSPSSPLPSTSLANHRLNRGPLSLCSSSSSSSSSSISSNCSSSCKGRPKSANNPSKPECANEEEPNEEEDEDETEESVTATVREEVNEKEKVKDDEQSKGLPMILCKDQGKTNGYHSDDDSTEDNEDEDNDEDEDDEGYRLPPQKRVRETESLNKRTKANKATSNLTNPPRQTTSSPLLSETTTLVIQRSSQSSHVKTHLNLSPGKSDSEKPKESLTRRIAMRKASVKVEPINSAAHHRASKSFLIEDILDFKGKTDEERLNCSLSESKDSVDNIINQIKSAAARQINSSNGRGNIVRPWDTRPATSASLIGSTMKSMNNSLTSLSRPTNSPLITTPPPSLATSMATTTGSTMAAAFRSNGFPNGLLTGSRGHLHAHLHPQPQTQLQLHHSSIHQHAPTTPSPLHHHIHHHNVHSGKHGLTSSNIRPRSADDDSQSERSESSDATTGGPDSPANSNLLPQNSPLECLYELTNKAFDRINGDKSMDGSSDHLNIFSNRPPPKKKRKSRTAFTNTQIFELERKFIQQRYLSPADRDDLASRLGLTGPQVITWFQNRRAKDKREKEETKNDLKTIYPFPEINIYDNIQDLSMLKVPDIRASLHFHRDHLDMDK